MNFQDILKIKRANIKVLFCNKLINEINEINEIDDLSDITTITNNKISYQNGEKVLVDDSVRNANYVAKYSSFEQLKTLLRDTIEIKEDAGRVNIHRNGDREYKAKSKSNVPVIYFWISGHTIFYVGKAGNGCSNRSKQHQNGWNRKAKKKRISENRLLLKSIYPDHPTEFNTHHEFEVKTIPVNQVTITDSAHLEALSPFEESIPSVPVDIIDELEKIFIFICQPQINTTHKNGDGLNFEILKNIL